MARRDYTGSWRFIALRTLSPAKAEMTVELLAGVDVPERNGLDPGIRRDDGQPQQHDQNGFQRSLE
ncbi:hypothetical protein [Lysobacter arvi]|uniref:Uncharacterized protein n=1 Tax=Lysobacter arvi TaxID=3038776 RepID=A0ABU1CEJ8_9GAMM|nr:hypothetical protein [Lysobacter arvi]MDR0182870.1 hypothetical protein [Lysobacter arvi]